MHPLLKQFGNDTNGSVVITLAFAIVVVLTSVGAAVDYTAAVNAKAELQIAADAAALGAISEMSPGVIAALEEADDDFASIAIPDSKNLFEAQIGVQLASRITNKKFNVTREGNEFYSEITYAAEIPTQFLHIVGFDKITVTGTARAKYAANRYLNFYMLLDNSPSMGLGATAADIQKLQQATFGRRHDGNCAFACHIEGSTDDYYTLAKNLGITTRVQMVAASASAVIDTARKTRRYPDQFGISVYSLGERAADAKLTRVARLSTDLDAVAEAANSIELMSIPSRAFQNWQTDLHSAIKKLGRTIIKKGGSGYNAADREQVLFMVTDGLEDVERGHCAKPLARPNRCQQPLDDKICKQLKKKGIRIAVLYTTYHQITVNSWYNNWIKPFHDEIGENLKNCASDGLFFEVSPGQGIQEAMNALYQKVVSKPRLTQ
jgi:Flp pilus assembly protein TadG